MPYARRGRYRGRRRVQRRRRAPPSRGSIYGAAARQLYKDVAKLKNMINVEYKFHDYSSTNSLTTTPTINCINFVNEGDTDQTHDGAMFRMKSLAINGYLFLNAGTIPYKARVALVLDTNAAASTTAPTYAEIYDSTGLPTQAMRNLDNRSRFVIMKQWDIVMNPNGQEGFPIKYFRNLDHKVQIVGTATETNLRKNGLYLVMLSDTATADNVKFEVTTRIRYIDN